ncbi:lamin tail domain-containing protein [Luteolibacter soli]|uniref:Lamin tail domain-containing protein n=1 Tax=Luteolibacter soli TaxID=3135280 RepID=A0ABU9AUT8_9BACT
MKFQALCLASALTTSLPANVVISEVMYHPASHRADEEFIELFNDGAAPVSLAGWSFTSGVDFTFPAGTTIPSGGRLVVAADLSAFSAKYPTVTGVQGGWTGRLSNSANHLVLADAAGVMVDEIEYADDGDWGTRVKDTTSDFGHFGWHWDSAADGGGSSLELIQTQADNSSGQNWAPSTIAGGTPGAANSVATADIAPFIREVAHFPVVPSSSDPVHVTARITDDHAALAQATVQWRVDGAPAFQAITMVDDGLHGDSLASDGIFGATLPVQPQGTIIEFYVTAADGASHVRTWPAPALGQGGVPEQTMNCLYQVDDAPYAGAMPIYRMILRAVDRQELTRINTNSPSIPGIDQTQSEVQMNATFISADGTGSELRYRCGLRNRGNSSRSAQPQSFRINFLNAEPWDDVTALNLNTQNTPYQLLGSSVFRKAGATMAASRAVQVRVNAVNPTSPGAPSHGFYAANEVINSEFADTHFPLDSSGNAYRVVDPVHSSTDPGGDLGDRSNHADPALADPTPYRTNYSKLTNTAEDKWADLIGLTQTLAKGHGPLDTPAYDTGYASLVRDRVDVRQWMSYFAMNTIADNTETNLSNGYGDDFSIYFGVTDPRAKLIPYDLDSIFGRSASSSVSHGLFLMCQAPALTGSPPTPLNPFMKQAEFAPVYYAELKRMLDGVFAPANFDAAASEVLGGLVDPAVISSIKSFNTQRTAWIATQIPLALSVTTAPPDQSGYPHSTLATTALGGRANAITTRSVKVNGAPVAWTAWTASWSAPAVTLRPGINRVLIQAFDSDGVETERLTKEVWFDDGSLASASGTISTDTTWSAAGGPWQITASLSVASGATLTIDPGASVYVASGASITVASGGRILAHGTEALPIRIGPAPGSGATWPGIVINGAAGSPRTIISHVKIDGNTSTAIDVNAGDVAFDHLQFGNSAAQYLSFDGASFAVSDCVFPAATAPFELVHGTLGVKAGGRAIIRHCYFGSPIGYNDTVDFTGGQRPAPIIQLINNVFAGSGDDMLDLDGTDAWVEGNIFLHCHKNGAPDSSAAISGGSDGSATSEVTIVGNIFYDVDHAVTAKQGNYYTFINNTVVHQTITGGTDIEGAVLNLQDAIPSPPTTYAAGLYAEANVLADCEQLLRNYNSASTAVTIRDNLMNFPWTGSGTGNADLEPLFVHLPEMGETNFTSWEEAQAMKEWLSLKPGSPARHSGPNGRDKGGVIPVGVCLSANVPSITPLASIQATVGAQPSATPSWASGYTHYRWRLDGGAWSAVTPIATPISLSGLAAGDHTLQVAGRNDALFFQDDPEFGEDGVIASFIWTINPAYVPPAGGSPVKIHEVLAKNLETRGFGGTFPDIIELHNDSASTVNISNWGLSDDPLDPYRYSIPAGTTIAAGAYKVIYASSAATVPNPKTDFGLSDGGEILTLTRSPSAGGTVADSVTFGLQLADYSIGRRESDGEWDLCRPTFGDPNVVATQGDLADLCLNEWLASAGALATNDFIEIRNRGSLPVHLGGCHLTDNPVEWPGRSTIQPLTYIAGNGYAVFKADGDPQDGADHVSFKLSASQGEIGLFDPDLGLIDQVIYGPQTTDISQGRTPDGATQIAFFTQPTPGGPNPGSTAVNEVQTMNLIPVNAAWKFRSTATSFAGTFEAPAFNDSAWVSGGQTLYIENATLTSPTGFVKTTALPANAGKPFASTYFRTHFNWSGSTDGVVLEAKVMMDDGVVIYLNGQEAKRVRMNAGTVSYSTTANATVDDATEETISLPASMLVQGDNVIAVEVHQVNTGSTDVVWAMKLDALVPVPSTVPPVRINEVLVRNQSLPNPDSSLASWIELFNPADQALSIADMSLSTQVTSPRAWVVPAGTTIPAGGHWIVQCDPTLPASATNTGFALNRDGGGIFLFHAPVIGGGLRDSISFGHQLSDLAIGRMPDGSGPFVLTVPTRGAMNATAATGPVSAVSINEWLAVPASGPDRFELFNSSSSPVPIGGSYLTDLLTDKRKQLVPPLSYIGTGDESWLDYIADDNGALPGHVNFSLANNGESLGLFTSAGAQVAAVAFGKQDPGISQGHYPDGSVTTIVMPPTPGAANQQMEPDSDSDGMPDAWEISHGFNRLSAADAILDADRDGMTNLDEYLADTDPRNGASRFTGTLGMDAGVSTIRFMASAGRTYTIQFSDSLSPTVWQTLVDLEARPTSGEISVADPAASGQPRRFYRIITPALAP